MEWPAHLPLERGGGVSTKGLLVVQKSCILVNLARLVEMFLGVITLLTEYPFFFLFCKIKDFFTF